MRQTHTYADLPVSRRAYFEIRGYLENLGVEYMNEYIPRPPQGKQERIIFGPIALVIDRYLTDVATPERLGVVACIEDALKEVIPDYPRDYGQLAKELAQRIL